MVAGCTTTAAAGRGCSFRWAEYGDWARGRQDGATDCGWGKEGRRMRTRSAGVQKRQWGRHVLLCLNALGDALGFLDVLRRGLGGWGKRMVGLRLRRAWTLHAHTSRLRMKGTPKWTTSKAKRWRGPLASVLRLLSLLLLAGGAQMCACRLAFSAALLLLKPQQACALHSCCLSSLPLLFPTFYVFLGGGWLPGFCVSLSLRAQGNLVVGCRARGCPSSGCGRVGGGKEGKREGRGQHPLLFFFLSPPSHTHDTPCCLFVLLLSLKNMVCFALFSVDIHSLPPPPPPPLPLLSAGWGKGEERVRREGGGKRLVSLLCMSPRLLIPNETRGE